MWVIVLSPILSSGVFSPGFLCHSFRGCPVFKHMAILSNILYLRLEIIEVNFQDFQGLSKHSVSIFKDYLRAQYHFFSS